MVIEKYHRSTSSEDTFLHHVLVQCWKRVSFRIVISLSSNGYADLQFDGLNNAIRYILPDFQPEEWEMLDKPYHHWLKTLIESEGGQRHLSKAVHYNILTGEVRVNDSPLTRLPRRYTDHEVYASLFEMMPIQTTESSERGMEFQFEHLEKHMTIHMRRKKNEDDLLVVVEKEGNKFDLVPARVFENAIPTAFVNEYHHWFDPKTGEIEFTPKNKKWPSNENSWSLRKVGTSKWKLGKAHT